MQQSYACATQVAVVLCPYLLTTEGSFDSPTAEPKCPGCKPAHTQFALFLRLRHPSMLSKRRFVSTGWEPKTKTKSIHFIVSSFSLAAATSAHAGMTCREVFGTTQCTDDNLNDNWTRCFWDAGWHHPKSGRPNAKVPPNVPVRIRHLSLRLRDHGRRPRFSGTAFEPSEFLDVQARLTPQS